MYELRALPPRIAVLGSWRPRVEKSWFTGGESIPRASPWQFGRLRDAAPSGPRPGEWKERVVNFVTSPSLGSDLVRPLHWGPRCPSVSAVEACGVQVAAGPQGRGGKGADGAIPGWGGARTGASPNIEPAVPAGSTAQKLEP